MRGLLLLHHASMRFLRAGVQKILDASPTSQLLIVLVLASLGILYATQIAGTFLRAIALYRQIPGTTNILVAAVLIGIFVTGVLVAGSVAAVIHQKTRHWERTRPERFHQARTLWTTLVLAHHSLHVPAYTPLSIHAATLCVAGFDTKNATRATRRAVFRHTARELRLSAHDRLFFALSLWFATRARTAYPYIPPSAHAIMAAQRAVLRARVTQHRPLRLLSTHTM